MDIFSGIASVLSGGVTGLVGTVTQKIFEYKSKQLDVELQKTKYANEIELKKADAAIMQQEWASRTQIAQVETAGASDVQDGKAFAAALTSEPQRYSTGNLSAKQNWLMVLLDFLRGVIRPLITVYLSILVTLMYIKASKLVPNSISIADSLAMVDKITNTLLYVTTTVILFWFGSRNPKK